MIIKKLKVKGFRGFVDEKEFDFSSPVTILFGENGKGKSSILNAIEWCLFGNKCVGKDTGIRERVNWEIKNRNSADCFVEIEIEDGNKKSYTLKRKLISKEKDELILSTDGKELKGDMAKEEIVKLLGKYTFKDFSATVYQHQEVIRFILTQEPSARNEALDRLFGLSEYRNIIAGINSAKNSAKIEPDKLQNEIDSLTNQIKAKIDVWRGQINSKTEELKDDGIQEVNKEMMERIGEGIKTSLSDFSQKINIALSSDFSSIQPTEPKRFVDLAQKEIRRLRSEMPDVKRQEEIFSKQTELQKLLSEYKNANDDLGKKARAFKEFITKNGDIKNLENKKTNIENEIKNIEKEKEKISLQGAIVKKAIDYLEEEWINKNICPVCGKETEGLLEHLKKEWEMKYQEQMGKLEEELRNKKEELKRVEKLISDYNELSKNNEEAKNKVSQVVEKIEKSLEIKITERDDPEVFLNKELENIKKELGDLSTGVKDKQEKLTRIDREISIFEKINEILKLIEQREKSRSVENTSEWKELNDRSEELKKFGEKINEIIGAIQQSSQEEAKSKIDSAKEKISEYFKKISNHPGIEKIEIKVTEDSKTRGNNYEFKDDKDKDVTLILSQGNYNALALSIFLATASIIDQPFAFLIFDDPSQSLGSSEKERFIEVLNEITKTKNVILSTMDSELYKLIKNKAEKAKITFEFTDWQPDKGPIYTTN